MKRLLVYILIISVGINIIFLLRKIKRINRGNEQLKLHFYKKIPYEEGYADFLDQMEKSYPETNVKNKYFIVFRWDSIFYESMFSDQMKVLDSMAASYGKYQLEYVFATEMEKEASQNFLKRNYAEYTHVRMLYGMDDYLSGLYSNKNIKLFKPTVINSGKEKDEIFNSCKQLNLYLIMDPGGKILYTNENRFMVVKDTAFLNKLNGIVVGKNLKILD